MTRRYALVTGASRGIGAAIARRLAGEGYDLTLAARNETPLDEVATAIAAGGAIVQAVTGDLSSEEDVRRVAAAHLERFPVLHLLVLSAGMAFAGEVAGFPLRRLDRMVAVNLRAPLVLVQSCLPALRKAAAEDPDRGARVVALASMSGVVAEPLLGLYGATKAALISLCEAITVEESAHGVSATAVSPGFVDTDMGAWATDHIERSSMLEAADVAELVASLTRLSARAVVPNLVVARAGPQVWRA